MKYYAMESTRLALLTIVMLAVASCSSASPTPQRTGKIFLITSVVCSFSYYVIAHMHSL